MAFEDFSYLGLVVEGSVVKHDQAVWPERRDEHFFDPSCYGEVGATGFEKHGSQPFLATLGHNQVRPLAIIALDFSVNFLPAN